jgi:hypothetical protein
VAALAIGAGIGIAIGYFVLNKANTTNADYKYDRLTRPADPKTYKTFIDSIQPQNIEDTLK